MSSSVIKKSVFLFIALPLLASCSRGGVKLETKRARTTKPAAKAEPVRSAKISTGPTGTWPDYNGVTRSGDR